MNYKDRLGAMIASTISQKTHGEECEQVVSQLKDAILLLNYDQLEWLKKRNQGSGVTLSPTTVLTEAEKEMAV